MGSPCDDGDAGNIKTENRELSTRWKACLAYSETHRTDPGKRNRKNTQYAKSCQTIFPRQNGL